MTLLQAAREAIMAAAQATIEWNMDDFLSDDLADLGVGDLLDELAVDPADVIEVDPEELADLAELLSDEA
jgi:hypothetical protein